RYPFRLLTEATGLRVEHVFKPKIRRRPSAWVAAFRVREGRSRISLARSVSVQRFPSNVLHSGPSGRTSGVCSGASACGQGPATHAGRRPEGRRNRTPPGRAVGPRKRSALGLAGGSARDGEETEGVERLP